MRTIHLLFAALFAVAVSCKSNDDKKEAESFPATWLEEITVSELQKGYSESRYTVKEVVAAYLSRIDAIDMKGPTLNSVLAVNPDAMAIAARLDSLKASGAPLGPLFGVPVLLKDNIDTHDKMPNTGGSRALANSFPAKDSPVAAKLREAGAVIIGKANLSEWANFRSENSSSGWSGAGGQTKNPYVLDRNPCGSSSGSGVSVSANLCVIAIGTETNGSIVCPSNNNGIVGIKPTVGLLSRSGIIPISWSQDTPGPMARTVEDAVIALGAMTGIDSSDTKTLASQGNALKDYTPFLKVDGLKGKKIGLMKDMMGFSEKVDTLIMKAAKDIIKQGGEIRIIDVSPRGYGQYSYDVLLYEFKDGINKYLAGLGEKAPVKNLAELIEFNKKDSVELSVFDQKIFELSENKGDLDSKEYKEAAAKILKATREDGIDKLLREFGVDALMAPTGSPAWKTDHLLGDHYVGGNSSLAAIAGYPAITVPAGFVGDMPVGITFFSTAWSEPLLIEIAYSYEQVTLHRKAPLYKVTD
jgi:amidase